MVEIGLIHYNTNKKCQEKYKKKKTKKEKWNDILYSDEITHYYQLVWIYTVCNGVIFGPPGFEV